MKLIYLTVPTFIIAAGLLTGCSQTTNSVGTNEPGGLFEYTKIQDLPRQNISEQEREDLLLLRQEESLAGDLYASFHDTHGHRIYDNIARSEDQHTGAVKALLDKYKIADPVKGTGSYTDDDLQTAFKDLQSQGAESHTEALKAAAYLEERDIRDLNNALNNTDNEDITMVYESLRKGSANHLKAFQRQLDRQGEQYDLQYITQDQVETYRDKGIKV